MIKWIIGIPLLAGFVILGLAALAVCYEGILNRNPKCPQCGHSFMSFKGLYKRCAECDGVPLDQCYQNNTPAAKV